MSYMEDHVLSYKAPLYGRRTAQMQVQPFDFADTCQYFKNFSDEDNIKKTFLNPTSSLFEEPENQSIIVRGAADLAYRRIEPHLPDYMGKVFEEICRQYLWRLLLKGETAVEFKELGRWWGTDPSARSQVEIDIMGEQDKNNALFGECKWTHDKVDAGVLKKLVNRSRLFHYKKTELYLFAKNGFTNYKYQGFGVKMPCKKDINRIK